MLRLTKILCKRVRIAQATGRTVQTRQGQTVFLSKNAQTDSDIHLVPYSLDTGFSPRGKSEQDLKLTTHSSAGVKNVWSYTSTASVCFRGMYRDNFIFTFTF